MKLATWNVNSLGVRLPQVLDWLAANPVDVLALQELKLTDDKSALFNGFLNRIGSIQSFKIFHQIQCIARGYNGNARFCVSGWQV